MFPFRSLMPRVLLVAALVATALPAGAADLLRPEGGAHPSTIEVAPGELRRRLVVVDPLELEKAVGPAGMGADQARVGAPVISGKTMTLKLFPGTTVTLKRRASHAAYGGGIVWMGRASKPHPAEGTFVVKNGRVTGVVTTRGRMFEIDPLRGKTHVLREIAPGRMPPVDFAMTRPKPPAAAPDGVRVTGGNSNTEVTVLIGYTDAAYGSVPNIVEKVNLAVSLANQAFSASAVKIRYKLVGAVWAAYYDESRLVQYEKEDEDEPCPTVYKYDSFPSITYEDNLKYVRNGCGYLDILTSERDRLKADLVTLFVKREEYCSFSYSSASQRPVPASYAYSVVSTGCVAAFAYSKATGFSMGLLKDRFVTHPGYRAGYRFGYADIVGRVRDIMSDPDRCTAAGVDCTLVNRYSNPGISIGGRRFGIPIGELYQTDAASFLNKHRATVAKFR